MDAEGKRGMTGKHLAGRVGPRANAWKGGRRVGPYGYVYVWVGLDHPLANSRGYATEHRLVMSASLSRPLTRSEIVHHLNGDKTDNRLDNLELSDRRSHPTKHTTWVKSAETCPACGQVFVPPRKPRFALSYCSRPCAFSTKPKMTTEAALKAWQTRRAKSAKQSI